MAKFGHPDQHQHMHNGVKAAIASAKTPAHLKQHLQKRLDTMPAPMGGTMPFKSQAQQKFMNANRAQMMQQGVNVDEWNQASKGKKLPMRAKKKAAPKMSAKKPNPFFGEK